MATLEWPVKDPDEVLDYTLDWTQRLAGDTIETSDWTVPDGLSAGVDPNAPSNTATKTVIWLSGGAEGTTYLVKNKVTTAGGRTLEQTVKLKCKSK